MAMVGKLSVVVAQHGADLAVCRAAAGAVEGVCETLLQRPDETPSQLTSRVRARLSTLSEAGCRIDSAHFVARTEFDVRDVLAAAGVLRGLVSAMVAAGTVQVHLHAEPRDLQTRYALTALAEAMSDELHGTGVEFVTHFAAPAQSGVARKPVRTSAVPR